MARKSRRLAVVITPAAKRDLDQIWVWNAEDKGAEIADAYDQFLTQSILKLGTRLTIGRQIPLAPDCRYLLISKKTRGHGHYVVYQVVDKTVEVLRLFHTRQDWQNRFIDER